MRIRRRTLRRLFPLSLLLLLFAAPPASSQNLLVNPGFDRDLSGWTVENNGYPPGVLGASAAWETADVLGHASGSVRLRLEGSVYTVHDILVSQCAQISAEKTYVAGGWARIDAWFGAFFGLGLELFTEPGCAGTAATRTSASPRLRNMYPAPDTSNGKWLPISLALTAVEGVKSARLTVEIFSANGFGNPWSTFDGLFDDAYLVEQADPASTWILPSAGRGAGAAGSLWTTTLTLANPDPVDALVALKFLGHDANGRSGDEKTFLVRAGTLVEYADVLGTLFGRTQDYGAIRIASSSANLVVQSETSTPWMGGTVGQALPAFGPSDYASATPKTLAPIRENESFRTNLVLANPTEIPITAHVVLFSGDGTRIGSRDVDLPPLGMTQINRVASALGAASLDAGRISVSAATPGGLVAAYASVIDNVTNDPRTLLPQDTMGSERGPNLLKNPGFDRDLAGWISSLTSSGSGSAFVTWGPGDSSASPTSGSASLSAGALSQPPGIGTASLAQCVPALAGRSYGLRASVRTYGSGFPGPVSPPILRTEFFSGNGCAPAGLLSGRADSWLLPSNGTSSGGTWYSLFAPATTAPAETNYARVSLIVSAQPTGIHGAGTGADFDDVVFSEGDASRRTFLPAVASVVGSGGSTWTSGLTLVNAGTAPSTVYLEAVLGDVGFTWVTNLGAGQVVTVRDALVTLFGRSSTWGPIRISATSPSAFVVAETSTPTASGGTVGQALAATGSSELIGTAPKSIAPVRDDGAFRTNLVLANTKPERVTVHVDLLDASGASLGSRDVNLDPLGAMQIGGVGWALAGASVPVGRLAISTPTPGGLVAAYASVIDNVTNDPRTLLPR